MDLASWISSDLNSLQARLANGVIAHLPLERRSEQLDELSIAPTYILWHMARHQDVAINRMIRGRGEVVEDWTDRLGVHEDLWRGLAEGQDGNLVDQLAPDAVEAYTFAVIESTLDWLASGELGNLERVPDTDAGLRDLGAPTDQLGWLYSMWEGKNVHFFLQWEAIGHGYNHLGELMSIRNRMGLSPF